MSDIALTITERPLEMAVELDFSLLSYRDLLAFQEAQRNSPNDAATQELIAGLVSKVTGKDALDLPAIVYLRVADAVVDRLQGSTSAKN